MRSDWSFYLYSNESNSRANTKKRKKARQLSPCISHDSWKSIQRDINFMWRGVLTLPSEMFRSLLLLLLLPLSCRPCWKRGKNRKQTNSFLPNSLPSCSLLSPVFFLLFVIFFRRRTTFSSSAVELCRSAHVGLQYTSLGRKRSSIRRLSSQYTYTQQKSFDPTTSNYNYIIIWIFLSG